MEKGRSDISFISIGDNYRLIDKNQKASAFFLDENTKKWIDSSKRIIFIFFSQTYFYQMSECVAVIGYELNK